MAQNFLSPYIGQNGQVIGTPDTLGATGQVPALDPNGDLKDWVTITVPVSATNLIEGILKLATIAQTDAATDPDKAVTPASLANIITSIALNTLKISYPSADSTKVGFLTVNQAVDLDQMEPDIAANQNGMIYKFTWDASVGTFPGGGLAQVGWFYRISVAGTVNGITFDVGDNIVATVDNASTTIYAANWSKHDQTDAVQSVVGLLGSITKTALLAALNVEDGANNYTHPDHTGDVTSLGDGALTIGALKVTNAMLTGSIALAKLTTPPEANATADQTDLEIKTAYNNQVGIVSQADAEAGTSTARKGWTAQRIRQAIDFKTECLSFAASDETTDLTTGTAKTTFRMPYAFTLTGIRASLTTAPTGSTLIADINAGGTSIMTTSKLVIDLTEKTTETAATAPVLTTTALADDQEITVDIDQIGSTIAGKGLKISLIGHQ